MWKTAIASIILIQFTFGLLANNEIQEVEIGKNAVLHCKNDHNHSFLFWYISKDGTVIGPRNKHDETKYKYEVLSGNLTIRSVTSHESGLYNCVSEKFDTREIAVRSVNMIVKGEWKELWDTESGTNLWPICVALGSILIILVIFYVVLIYRNKNKERRNYFDIVEDNDDEDSTDELFSRDPSTSGVQTVPDKNETDNFEEVYTKFNTNNP